MLKTEKALIFDCEEESLLGILHTTEKPSATGVVLVVGGPQYRIGSHRQFVLIARFLANKGIPVFRFDYRGMGDSTGSMRTFEAVNSDIKAAIDQFKSAMNGVENIVLWGLCDAASACSFFAPTDTRVKGLVLVNPWVRTEQGLAKALVTDYYWERLTSRSFWKKVLSGHFRIGESFTSFAKALGKLFSNQFSSRKPHTDTRKPDNKNSPPSAEELPIRVRNSIESFNGKSLLILSGNDLTAAEFINTTKADRKWRKLLKRPAFTHKTLKDADHTFSSRKWREDVCLWTVEWIETTLSKR